MNIKTKTSKEPEKINIEWLVTFNDLMTLLLVFFVLVFIISSMDKNKIREFQHSFESSMDFMNPLDKETKKVVKTSPSPDIISSLTPEERAAEARKHEIDLIAKELESLKDVGVVITHSSVTIRLKGNYLFESGTAHLNPESYIVLDNIISILKKNTDPIRVEGHTDNIPISTDKFPSNWELSTYRAINALKYLVEGGIPPQRITVIGYGDSKPLFPNDTQENKAKNRRIEIVVEME